MLEPQGARIPAPRVHPPHAAKAMSNQQMIPDGLLGIAIPVVVAAMVPADILRAASIGIRSHNKIINASSAIPTLERHPIGRLGAVIAVSLMAMAYLLL